MYPSVVDSSVGVSGVTPMDGPGADGPMDGPGADGPILGSGSVCV